MTEDDPDWPPEDEDGELDADAEATPGERLLYALAQVEYLQRSGRLPRRLETLSVEDVARIIGVAGKLEFVSRDAHAQHCHFPGEVVVISSGRNVTRRLYDLRDWADYQEWADYMDDWESGEEGE